MSAKAIGPLADDSGNRALPLFLKLVRLVVAAVVTVPLLSFVSGAILDAEGTS